MAIESGNSLDVPNSFTHLEQDFTGFWKFMLSLLPFSHFLQQLKISYHFRKGRGVVSTI